MSRTNDFQTRNDSVHRSPPPGIVAVVFVLFFVASIVANAMMTGGAPYPTPYMSIAELQDYYTRFPHAIRIAAFLQFGAVPPLGIFTATMVSRLLFHRIKVAGVYIALFGGMASAFFLGVSSLSAWALSQPGVAADAGAMRVAQLIAFAFGGFGHVVTFGILLAGISIPGLVFRLMPRWVCWAGLIIAAICVISYFSMIFPEGSVLLPLGRFPGYLWLIAAGFTLPKTR